MALGALALGAAVLAASPLFLGGQAERETDERAYRLAGSAAQESGHPGRQEQPQSLHWSASLTPPAQRLESRPAPNPAASRPVKLRAFNADSLGIAVTPGSSAASLAALLETMGDREIMVVPGSSLVLARPVTLDRLLGDRLLGDRLLGDALRKPPANPF